MILAGAACAAAAVLVAAVGPPHPGTAPAVGPGRVATFTLDCAAPAPPISPFVYGIAALADGADHFWRMRPTARRWGGNASSRFNWELGDAWNTNHDWFFENAAVSPARRGYGWEAFLDEDRTHRVETALTIPMLGWVAKDTTSSSYPRSRYAAQHATAPDRDAGDGLAPDGTALPADPRQTSVRSTPESIERWVRRIRERDRGRTRSVSVYILDNEPTLWHTTHRDVHPEPVGYDELLERTVAYASAIRRADPDARIAGPALWGWLAFQYSGIDVVAGPRLAPDRRRHGDVALLPWYLRSLREREARLGVRLLDVVDVHFYPANPAIGAGTGGATDPGTAALRIRATRSLWDPTYVDESWIAQPMAVIPLLRRWVRENHPGLGISIGEWNFGAESHMSGGLAVAEALGRFGTEGLTSAYYWNVPPDGSPAYWAFRAYRDFDGAGAAFEDRSVPVAGGTPLASVFASRDEAADHVVAVLLNEDPAAPLDATVELTGCAPIATARRFSYSGEQRGFAPAPVAVHPGRVVARAAPYSIEVLDVHLVRRDVRPTRKAPP